MKKYYGKYWAASALAASEQVADFWRLPEETRKYMRIAAERSPWKALVCYRAILRSYGLEK